VPNIKNEDLIISEKSLQKGGTNLESKILEIINKDTSNDTSSYVGGTIGGGTTAGSYVDGSVSISNEPIKKETIDDKIKNILEKNLGETDLNTSLSYRPETNEKEYQEIFSNNVSGGGVGNDANTIDNKEKDSSKSKRKFFNNYLNF
jgi:hypothetical protein